MAARWRLSVALTGDGGGLQHALRRSSADARRLQRDIDRAREALRELRDAAHNGISVDVTAAAGSLRAQVQAAVDSAGDNSITVGLSVDGDHLRQEVAQALTSAGAGQGLAVDLQVTDAGRLRSEVQAAVQAADGKSIIVGLSVDGDHLRQEVSQALSFAGSGQDLAVDLGIGDPLQLRRDVTAAVRWAAEGQRITVPLDIDTSAAADLRASARAADTGLEALRTAAREASHSLNSLQRYAREAGNELRGLRTHALGAAAALRSVNTAARSADGRLATLSTRARALRTDLDALDGSVQHLGGSLGGLSGSVGSLSSSGQGAGRSMRGVLAVLVGLATAIVPVAASALPLAATFGAAGASAVAFGIALAGQIGALKDAAEAQTKLDEAIREHGATSQQAAAAQQALHKQVAAMPAPTQQASAALASLKAEYREWSDATAGDTMPVVTKGFQTLSVAVPKLTPMVKGAADQMDRLITVGAGAVASGGLDRVLGRFEKFSTLSLRQITDQVVHLMRVFSQGGDSSTLRDVMDYARRVGPQVAQTLHSLGDAFVTVLESASEMGIGALAVVNALAHLVGAVPPEALTVFFQLALAMKAVQLASRGMTAVGGVVAALTAQLGAARTAAAGAAGPLASLAAGFGALSRAAKVAVVGTAIGALVVALTELSSLGDDAPPDIDKLTSSLGEFARTGKVSGEAARVFGKDLSGMAEALRTLARPSNSESVQQFLTQLIGMDSTPVARAKETIDGLDKALAGLVKNGNPALAEAAFNRAAKAMGNLTPGELKAELDDYKSALADAQFEQQLAAEAMGLFGQQALATSAKLNAQKASADGLRQAVQALNDAHRQSLGGMIGFEAAIDAAADAAKKNHGALSMTGGQLNLNSEKARNAATALNDLAAKTDEAAASARQSGASWETVNGIYQRGRSQLIASAIQMGLTSAQAQELASSILTIPDKKTTQLEMKKEDALAGLNAVAAQLKATPDAKSIPIKVLSQSAIDALRAIGLQVKQMPDGTFTVSAITDQAKANLAGIIRLIQTVPPGKSLTVIAETAAALANLETVKQKVGSIQGRSFTMTALTGAAEATLLALGYKVTHMKGGQVSVTVPPGPPKAQVAAIQAAINNLHGTTITNTVRTNYVEVGNPRTRFGGPNLYKKADGGVMDYYARGGIRRGQVRYFAGGGTTPGDHPDSHVAQIAPAGSYRVWGERETQGEGYVPFRRSARPRSRAITEEIVRRLGGDPASIQWNANGSVTDWRYDPVSGSLYSASDATSAARRTKKVTVRGKNGKKSTRDVEYVDVTALEAKLKASSKATLAWSKDLETVADRVGSDVAEALAGMGKDGVALTKKMAHGSSRYINEMAASLRGLAKTARASLGDYTRQLTNATKTDAAFQNNLAQLAAAGYGDLARQLAAQNDKAAQELAAAAVKDRRRAGQANAAAKTANNALTGEQVSQLVQVIAAVTSSKTGLHDVAAATGLGEDDIIAVATKARGQISRSLGSRATRFLADLGRAQKGLSYADGGIRPGIYATNAGALTFAEPSTGGEAFVPLGLSKRGPATDVLADVAGRFGYALTGLQDAHAGRVQVVVVQQAAPLIGTQTIQVDRPGATEQQIAAAVGYQVRRAQRGGVRRR